MNTPNVLNLNAVSNWVNAHKTMMVFVFSACGVGLSYFAPAAELKKTNAKVDLALLQNQMDEVRYHIDSLSEIPQEQRTPKLQRSLDRYLNRQEALEEKMIDRSIPEKP